MQVVVNALWSRKQNTCKVVSVEHLFLEQEDHATDSTQIIAKPSKNIPQYPLEHDFL